MAIVGTSPGQLDSNTTATSYVTPSWTPISGETVLVLVVWRKASAADAITSLVGTNGWSVTWTPIVGSLAGGTTLSRCMLFCGIPSSSVAGTLTATFPAAQLQGSIIPVSFSGVDQAISQGIVQFNSNLGAAGGALAVTLASFGNVDNATVLGGGARSAPTGFVAESGAWTSYTAITALQNGSIMTWLPSNDTTPTGTLTAGSNWAAVAVELKAISVSVGHPTMRRLGGVLGTSRVVGMSQVRIF